MLPIIKDVQDNIFVCEPLFPYYFLLIATMTKTTFANSQQLLCLILSICEVISVKSLLGKVNYPPLRVDKISLGHRYN